MLRQALTEPIFLAGLQRASAAVLSSARLLHTSLEALEPTASSQGGQCHSKSADAAASGCCGGKGGCGSHGKRSISSSSAAEQPHAHTARHSASHHAHTGVHKVGIRVNGRSIAGALHEGAVAVVAAVDRGADVGAAHVAFLFFRGTLIGVERSAQSKRGTNAVWSCSTTLI